MLNYAAVVLAASMMIGADESPDQGDLRILRPLLGTWEVPEFEHEGETHHVQLTWKPMLDGKFIECRWSSVNKDTDELVIAGLNFIGRDPGDGKLKFWEADTKGAISQLVLAEGDADKSTWEVFSFAADGTERTGKVTFDPIDRNSYDWSLVYDDGESRQATFQRTRKKGTAWPKPQLDPPEGVAEQLKAMTWWAGEFAFSGNNPTTGLLFNGRSNCMWILGGKFLLYQTASVDETLTPTCYRAVIGIDPTSGKPTGWEFSATGSIGTYLISDEGQAINGQGLVPDVGTFDYQGRITRTGDGLEYHSTGKRPDGTEVPYSFFWKRDAKK